jgi:hypothetical protein
MALLLVSATAANSAEQPNRVSPQESGNIEHGRYLTKITGCNDCHTPGYTQNAGKVEEKDWLIGDTLGWRGDWGTTYASNLRIYMKDLSESEWVEVAHTAEFLPPMPWFSLHDMTKQDLRALYSFIVRLGPAGVPAPPNLPPDQEPAGPYVLFPLLPK